MACYPNTMKPYLDLVRQCLEHGDHRTEERTGTGTRSVFGGMLEFDVSYRFPLLQEKETRYKVAFLEMLFFLRGEPHTKFLNDHGCKLWDAWADDNGNLGPVYGFNWRHWGAKPDNVPQPKPRLRYDLAATYLGVANGAGSSNHPLRKVWQGMVARCYDRNSVSYKHYGAKGVSVSDEWLEFAKFAEDAVQLPNWPGSRNSSHEWQLDKDTLGSGFVYSKDTCIWSSAKSNTEAAHCLYLYTVDMPDGSQETFVNITDFAKRLGVGMMTVHRICTVPGYIAKCGVRLVRKEPVKNTGFDQVAAVITNLKNDPQGRRHIVTAWNVSDLPSMGLPPCHHAHQLFVSSDGHLDMVVHQRSWDLGLGAPFNIAQYALLLHLYARAAGYTPRMLKFSYGDAHVYDNHVEGLTEMLNRHIEPDNARLVFHTDNTDIDGYTPDDFSIEGYNFLPFIKLPVAV